MLMTTKMHCCYKNSLVTLKFKKEDAGKQTQHIGKAKAKAKQTNGHKQI